MLEHFFRRFTPTCLLNIIASDNPQDNQGRNDNQSRPADIQRHLTRQNIGEDQDVSTSNGNDQLRDEIRRLADRISELESLNAKRNFGVRETRCLSTGSFTMLDFCENSDLRIGTSAPGTRKNSLELQYEALDLRTSSSASQLKRVSSISSGSGEVGLGRMPHPDSWEPAQFTELARKMAEADAQACKEIQRLQADLQEVRAKAFSEHMTNGDEGKSSSAITDLSESLTETKEALQDEVENIEYLHSELTSLSTKVGGLQTSVSELQDSVRADIAAVMDCIQQISDTFSADLRSRIREVLTEQNSAALVRDLQESCAVGPGAPVQVMTTQNGNSLEQFVKESCAEEVAKQWKALGEASAVPRGGALDEEPEVWSVCVTRGQGAPLGMKMHRTSLVVEAIKSPGLIERWNAEHPDRAVRVGDLILEVNGQRDPHIAMEECRYARELDIKVGRKPRKTTSFAASFSTVDRHDVRQTLPCSGPDSQDGAPRRRPTLQSRSRSCKRVEDFLEAAPLLK